MKNILCYASVLNTLYLITTFYTDSTTLITAPVGLTTLIALLLYMLNLRVKIRETREAVDPTLHKHSLTIKTTEVLCTTNMAVICVMIVFI